MLTSKHTTNMHRWLNFGRFIAIALSFVALAGIARADEANVYGPVNLVKTMATPFGSPLTSANADEGLAPLSLRASAPKNLASRLVPARLYLPGRMVIGQTAEFIIKGRAGSWAALAMADRNSGAKPIYGHELHLGADRKVVSLGQIPESGVLSLVIDTPIQGDLVGQPLYFEAAIWSRKDFSDVELAEPVPSESTGPVTARSNGVLMAPENDTKKGLRIVPDSMVPFTQRGSSMDSGRP